MITLEGDELVFSFPELDSAAVLRIELQRTLRVPSNDTEYPLPPGLGPLPLRHLDDFTNRLPADWASRGGVLAPIYQGEAVWLNFQSDELGYPFAVKIGTGLINAVTGEPWRASLSKAPQDYVVVPEQRWLDGYCEKEGQVRQFVAMPLGGGFTVEEQLTPQAKWGGIQILVYPLKRSLWNPPRRHRWPNVDAMMFSPNPAAARMGFGRGGRIRQEIFADRRDLDAWDQQRSARCFVSTVSSLEWLRITGERPPHRPPTARDYARAKLPWFEFYRGDLEVLKRAEKLLGTRTVSEIAATRGSRPIDDDEAISIETVVNLFERPDARPIREPESFEQ